MAHDDDDDELFLADDEEESLQADAGERWNVMVVDDDQDVHDATELSLAKEQFDGQGVNLIHAFSGKEAREKLAEHENIAVILLDVIMEDDQAGLKFARHVRESAKNKAIRIILRTGQPGMAPEDKIFEKYDIHDYKEKFGLTSGKLKTAVLSAIRAYRDIVKEIEQYTLQTNLFVSLVQLSRKEIDLKQCLEHFVTNISNIFYAPLGIVHICKLDGSYELPNQAWYSVIENDALTTFQQEKIQQVLPDTPGAVQQVLNTKTFHTEEDLKTEFQLAQLNKALDKPVKTVFAIPLIKDNQVAAIFEIFITEEPEERPLMIIETALVQFAALLDRIESEQKLQDRCDKLENTLNYLKEKQIDINQKIKKPQQEKQSEQTVENLESTVDQMIIQLEDLSKELMSVQLRLHGTVSAMPSVLIGIDNAQNVTDWNNQAEKACDVSAANAKGQPVAKVFPYIQKFVPKIEQALQENQAQTLEKLPNFFSKDTQQAELDSAESYHDLIIYPVKSNDYSGAVIRLDDVTEKIKIQEVLTQNEKMISIGGLASGVAHELNNPLSIIAQNAQNIQRRIDAKLPANLKESEKLGVDLTKMTDYLRVRKILDFITTIQKSSERAAYIASNLLQFSRRRKTIKAFSSFEDMLNNSIEFAANDSGVRKKINFKDIEIKKDIAPNLPEVHCYLIEIEQVLLNLIKNAAQAMGDIADRAHALHFKLYPEEDNNLVTLEITDTGPGMPKEVLDSVFEPFFTTKPAGEGTGLGLSVSYGIIVQNHKGKMSVTSEVDKGTTFKISLPTKEIKDENELKM